MEMVTTERIVEVLERLNVPVSLAKEISGGFSTMKEKTQACVDLYLSYFPDEPSWTAIINELYSCEEMGKQKYSVIKMV